MGPVVRQTVTPMHRRLGKELIEARVELVLDLSGVSRIDTAGVAMFASALGRANERGIALRVSALSEPAREAFSLFRVESGESRPPSEPPTLPERLGTRAEDAFRGLVGWLSLAADTFFLSIAGAERTRRVRRGAFSAEAVRIGVDALPIVGLISFLVGLVVALQAAYQLRQFGANIFVANLSALSMTREMGPLMTAIIVAGRSGASIAAEAATMKVSEEIDALEVMGLSPIRYVVVPKFQAITLTVPCLTMYANVVGILGGFLVGFFYLDIGATAFWNAVHRSLAVKDILTGLVKSVAFAWIISLIAAHQGFQARGGAESVGRVTTTSVVASIFWVIVADAAFSILFYFGD